MTHRGLYFGGVIHGIVAMVSESSERQGYTRGSPVQKPELLRLFARCIRGRHCHRCRGYTEERGTGFRQQSLRWGLEGMG